MAGLTVAAFYADVGSESRFPEFCSYGIAARKALALTNPAARFVILSDLKTGRKFSAEGFDVVSLADPTLPLMLQIIDAQRWFVQSHWDGDGLLVLPDIDAMANRQLDDATPEDHGLVITHKGAKFDYRINNLAYVRDRDLGAWFLTRAYRILQSFDRSQWHWWGDQEAWGAACGIPFGGGGKAGYWVPIKEYNGEKFRADPERGKTIWLYPCATHNATMAIDGQIRHQRDAYFVHFKGARKAIIEAWAAERFGEKWA